MGGGSRGLVGGRPQVKKRKGTMKVHSAHHTSDREVIHRVKDALKTYDQPHTTYSPIHSAHTIRIYH